MTQQQRTLEEHGVEVGLLQRITATELDRFIHEMDAAVESHIRWFAGIVRVLLCHVAPAAADLEREPHLHCRFGRWYHGIHNPQLKELPEFLAMEAVHRELHAIGRALLEQEQRGEPVALEEYNALVQCSEQLRTLITDLRSALKNNLNFSSKLSEKVFENATEGVVITDLDGTILSVNRAFIEVTGYQRDEVIGKTPNILYSGRQDDHFYARMWQALRDDGRWSGEIWNRRKNGEIYPEHLSITAVSDDASHLTCYVGIFSDITSEKENEARLYRLAHHDLLTDLPNRMLFTDRLRQALMRAKRDGRLVAVLFLDLDGFKAVNDLYGHGAGDELLCQVARRLEGCLRESDTVARFGGDEFTVVLTNLETVEGATAVAGKIVDHIARPYRLRDGEARVSTSVGISVYPFDGAQPDILVGNADAAMYTAKGGGKNRWCRFEAPGCEGAR